MGKEGGKFKDRGARQKKNTEVSLFFSKIQINIAMQVVQQWGKKIKQGKVKLSFLKLQ